MPKILVVDDEKDLVSLLEGWLKEENKYEVYGITSAEEALRLFFQYKHDLIITDLRMPGMNGFDLISRIRMMSDVYIMVLTALSNEEHIVRALNMGVDKYLVKPVRMRVFLAEMHSLLRRVAPPGEFPTIYSDDFLKLNFLTHEIWVLGQPLHLRPTEFRLLSCLVQNRERVVSHTEIMNIVWGESGSSLDSLKWYISSLREKIGEEPNYPRHIVTLPRVGYRYLSPLELEKVYLDTNGKAT